MATCLASASPREVACGASLASERQPRIREALEGALNRTLEALRSDENSHVIAALLDAFLRMGWRMAAHQVARLYDAFPDETRLSPESAPASDDISPLLNLLERAAEQNHRTPWLALASQRAFGPSRRPSSNTSPNRPISITHHRARPGRWRISSRTFAERAGEWGAARHVRRGSAAGTAAGRTATHVLLPHGYSGARRLRTDDFALFERLPAPWQL